MTGSFEIRITRRAKKDIQKLNPKLKIKLHEILIETIAKDSFQGKKLLGDLEGSYSYRLSIRDRIIYSINIQKGVIYIERAKTHYSA